MSIPSLQKRKLPTLADVAREAGVSTATASRCLNEPDKVSKTTRDRVLETVKRLHYAPNFGARAIAANRTGMFGAIIPTMENAIFARGIETFQETLVAHNKTMLVASSSYDPEQESQQIRTMVSRGADGILLIGTERNSEIYEFLSQRNIPCVIAWSISPNKQQSCVGFDNQAAAKGMMEKALEMGHRSFAFISAFTETNDRARNRVLGARMALSEFGLDPDSMPVVETDYSIASGRAACREILTASSPPTLIMCGNDVLAVGAIQAIQASGLRVPEDISVTGFDNIELATVVTPALTTVDVPHGQMGRLAAETLLQLVQKQSKPVRHKLDTSIVERASLGPR